MGHHYILTSIALVLSPEAQGIEDHHGIYTSTILDRLIYFECFTDGIMPNIEPAVIVNDANCSAK